MQDHRLLKKIIPIIICCGLIIFPKHVAFPQKQKFIEYKRLEIDNKILSSIMGIDKISCIDDVCFIKKYNEIKKIKIGNTVQELNFIKLNPKEKIVDFEIVNSNGFLLTNTRRIIFNPISNEKIIENIFKQTLKNNSNQFSLNQTGFISFISQDKLILSKNDISDIVKFDTIQLVNWLAYEDSKPFRVGKDRIWVECCNTWQYPNRQTIEEFIIKNNKALQNKMKVKLPSDYRILTSTSDYILLGNKIKPEKFLKYNLTNETMEYFNLHEKTFKGLKYNNESDNYPNSPIISDVKFKLFISLDSSKTMYLLNENIRGNIELVNLKSTY